MLSSMVRMGRSSMGVMGSLFMIAGLVVLSGFGVVFSSLRVVGGGVLVTLGGFLRHGMGMLGRPSGGACGCLRAADIKVGIAVSVESTVPPFTA